MRTRSPSWWASDFNPRTPRGVRRLKSYLSLALDGEFQSTHPARGATRLNAASRLQTQMISIHAPREGCDGRAAPPPLDNQRFQSTHPARGATVAEQLMDICRAISIHAPREGCDAGVSPVVNKIFDFNPRTPRGVRLAGVWGVDKSPYFNPRTPRGVRQQTLPKSREFAWLNLLICTRGRRLSIRKQTRLCSMKLSFMLFGCEPAGEGVSSWTSHATKSKVRLEGRSAYSQSVRSSAHSDFPGNKSGGCPVRDP